MSSLNPVQSLPMAAPVSSSAPVQQPAPATSIKGDDGTQGSASFARTLDKAQNRQDADKESSSPATPAADPAQAAASAANPADDPAENADVSAVAAAMIAASAALAAAAKPVSDNPVVKPADDSDGGAGDLASLATSAASPAVTMTMPVAPAASMTPKTVPANQNDSGIGVANGPGLTQSLASETPDGVLKAQGDKTEIARGTEPGKPLTLQTERPVAPAGSFEAALNSAEAASAQSGQAQAATASSHASATREATRTESPQFTVRTPVAQPGWADDVSNRVVWMAGKDLGRAELVLTPPHLGRIEVSISVAGDQASASFAVTHPGAYAALEDSLPRLREVMAQAGLNLSQVNVSTSNAGQDGSTSQGGQGSGRASRGTSDSLVGEPAARFVRSGNGLVDTFA